MRRIQLDIADEVDDALAAEAVRRGVSKARLVWELVASGFPPSGHDPIETVIAAGHRAPVEDIDAAVYAGR